MYIGENKIQTKKTIKDIKSIRHNTTGERKGKIDDNAKNNSFR